MAIRQKPRKSKPWEAYWNNPITGKRESKAFATKREAQKHDALIKYQLQFEREAFRPAAQPEPEPDTPRHTLETAYFAYLKEKQFSKVSLSWQLTSMKTALALLGDKRLNEITAKDLLDVKHALEDRHTKPVTVRGRLSVLRTVLRWCYANEMMDSLPRFPTLPPAYYEHIVPPSQVELAAMYEVAPEIIRRVIVLGAFFGMRVGPSEMFRLLWQDVDFPAQLVRVPSANKNAREPWREVPIREEIAPLMQSWQARDYAQQHTSFVVHINGRPVQSVKKQWRAAITAAGLRYFVPYALRHSFATNLLAAGVDAGTVAKLMGHTSTDMIFAHYQHIISAQKRQAIDALPALPCVHSHVSTLSKSPHA